MTQCEEVLARHGIHASDQSWHFDVANQINRLLYLFEQYQHSRQEIKARLQDIPNISKIINTPLHQVFDGIHTNLQMYIFTIRFARDIDLTVPRRLLHLGAQMNGDGINVNKYSLFYPPISPDM